jgi:hypothetical protein
MGAALGVALRGATFVTTGTSFQFSMFLAFDGGGPDGVEFLGGAPTGGGATGVPVYENWFGGWYP